MAIVRRKNFVACQDGVTAVEFALVLPPLIMLLIGLMSASLAVYSASSVRFAVEQAARCYSVDAAQCSSPTAAQNYATSSYDGMNTPTFTASIQACGHQVSGTVTVQLNAALVQWDIPLTSSACFP
jgi:Flp pilus assembly protein TadG